MLEFRATCPQSKVKLLFLIISSLLNPDLNMVHVLTASGKNTEISVEIGLSSKSAQFSASSPPSTHPGFRKGQISAVLELLRDPVLLIVQRFRSPHCSARVQCMLRVISAREKITEKLMRDLLMNIN